MSSDSDAEAAAARPAVPPQGLKSVGHRLSAAAAVLAVR
jgi:hypothetical protein